MDDVYLDSVLSGDVEAFGYFVKTYKNMAFNLAYSIIKDEQYAEEATQDAFMKAFTGLDSFKRQASFKSWFYRIVVNQSFLQLRKLKKSHQYTDLNEVCEHPFDDELNKDSSEILREIHKALDKLSSNESLALQLFYLEEMALNQITEITGWSLANTKVILHRARKNVRKICKVNL